jgi:hypothetical protein
MRKWMQSHIDINVISYFQVTELPLQHELSKIDMICFAKPGLTRELYVVHKEELWVTFYAWNTYTWLRSSTFVRDTTSPIVMEDITWGNVRKDYFANKTLSSKFSRDLAPRRNDWRESAIPKVSLTLTQSVEDSTVNKIYIASNTSMSHHKRK